MYAIVQYEEFENDRRNVIAVFLYSTQQEAETEIAYHEKRLTRFKYEIAHTVRDYRRGQWVEETIPEYAVTCFDFNSTGDRIYTVYLQESKAGAEKSKRLYTENCPGHHSIVPIFDSRKQANGTELSKTKVVE